MNNINIEHIKGRDLVDALNNAEELIPDHYDELYGCEFTYESQEIKDDFFVVRFAIEHGHYIKDNIIRIPRDISTLQRRHIGLEEPFEGSGMEDEVLELVKVFLDNFQVNMRDSKILSIIETEEQNKQRIKLRILEKLKDLTTKIETGEELPHLEQDYKLLSDIDDRLEEVLNNWYY